jgi:hypothetical protein
MAKSGSQLLMKRSMSGKTQISAKKGIEKEISV